MLNKNDPLIGAVQEVMRKNQAERDAVKAVNEKFGVVDRRALPHEQQANWDAAYAKVLTEGVEALDEDYDPVKRDRAREIEKRAKVLRRDRHGPVKDQAEFIAKKEKEDAVTGGNTAAGPKKAMQQLYGKMKQYKGAMKRVTVDEEELSPKQKMLAKLGGNKKKIDAPDLAAARAGKASHIEEAGMMPTGARRVIAKAVAGVRSMKASSDKKFADKYHPSKSANPVDRNINKNVTKNAEMKKKVFNRLEEDKD